MGKRGPCSWNQKRDDEIEARFLSQMSICDLADLFGVSRQRIQQILAKRGLTWKDGIRHKRAVVKKGHVRRRGEIMREVRFMRTWGCTRESAERLNGGVIDYRDLHTLAGAYWRTRIHVITHKKAVWDISFPQFCQLHAGKSVGTGVHRNAWCFTRIDHTKPYRMGNVCVVPLYLVRHIQMTGKYDPPIWRGQ